MKASVKQRFSKASDTFEYSVEVDGDVGPEDVDQALGQLEKSEYLQIVRKSMAEWMNRMGM